MRWRRRLARGLAALVVLAVLGLLTAAVVLRTDWLRGRLRDLVVTHTATLVDGTLRIGRLEGSLLSDVALDDVSITRRGVVVFAVKHVTAHYRLADLIHGSIDLDRVVVDAPLVTMERDGHGGWHVAGLASRPASSPSSSSRAVRIGRLQMAGGSFTLDDGAASRRFGDLAFDGSLDEIGGALSFAVVSAAGRDVTTGVRVTHFAGRVVVGRDLTIDHFDLATTSSHLTGDIGLRNWRETMTVDAQVTAAPLSFPEVARYQTWAERLPVLQRVEAKVSGPLDRLAFDLNLADVVAGRAHTRGTARVSPVSLRGDVDCDGLNLAALLGRPSLTSDLSGHSVFALDASSLQVDALDVTFDATLSHAEFDGYAGAGLAVRGSLRHDIVSFAGTGHGYGATADVTGTWTMPTSVLVLSGTFTNVDLRQLPARLSVPAWESLFAGRGRVTWSTGHVDASATLDTSTVLGATLLAGTTASIGLDGETFRYRGDVQARDVDVARVTSVVSSSSAHMNVDGRLNAHVVVNGVGPLHDWTQHTAHLSTSSSDSTLDGVHVSSFSADASLEGRRLSDTTQVAFAGSVDRWLPAGDRHSTLGGRADLTLVVPDVAGPWRAADLSATMRTILASSVIAGVPIDAATIDLSASHGVATIQTCDISGPTVRVRGSGTMGFDRSAPPSSLEYTIEAPDLARVVGAIAPGLGGGVTASGTLAGTLDHETTKGVLHGLQLKYASVDALALESTFTADLANADLRTLSASVSATATFVTLASTSIDRLDVTAQYDRQGIGVDLSAQQGERHVAIAGLVILSPGSREVRLRQLSLGSGRVTWALPDGREAQVIDDGNTLAIQGLDLVHDQQRISIDGTWTLHSAAGTSTITGPSSLSATIAHVQLADVMPIVLGPSQVSGLVDGRAVLGGTLDRPTFTWKGALTQAEVNHVPLASLETTLDYRDRRATVNVRLDASAGSALTVSGTAALGSSTMASAVLDLRGQGHLDDLAVVGPLITPLTNPHGSVTVDLRVGGTLSSPSLSGSASVDAVSFGVAATGVSYKNATATVRFDGRRMSIDAFSIADRDGHTLTAGGSIDAIASSSGARAIDLHATGASFHVLDNDLGEVVLDTNLTATGDTRAPTVTGSVRVSRGRLEVDEILDRYASGGYVSPSAPATTPAGPTPPANPTAASTSASPGGSASATGPPAVSAGGAATSTSPSATSQTAAPAATSARAGAIRLGVELPNNVVLRGQDLHLGQGTFGLGDINLIVGGHLDVTLVPGQPPGLDGRLTVVRGTYTFEGRRFDFDRDGSVEFHAGPGPIDPTLDLSAEREISGVTTTVTLAGTMRRPKLTLSSDPTLDQGDILSLIIFNRAINDLGAQEQTSLAQKAGEMAASALATPIVTSVGHALNLDVFDIQTTDAAGVGPTVTVGRQVSDKLFVGFRQVFGSGDVSLLTFEYQLSKFLRVVSSVAQGATEAQLKEQAEAAGIDLFFVIRK